MGLILVPSEIKTNMETLRSYLGSMLECYENVQEKISEYYADDELDTVSWVGSKNKMEICYRLIAEGMLSVQESVAGDIDTLLGCIGDEYLDEDKLNEQIEKLQEQVEQYEKAKAEWQDVCSTCLEAGYSGSTSGFIERYDNMIEDLKEQIAELREKIIFLHEAEDLTVNLFQSATDLLSMVQNAISDGGVNVTTDCGFPQHPEWLTVLSGKDEDSLEIENIEVNGRVVDQIIPEEVTAKVNGEVKVYYPRDNWFAYGEVEGIAKEEGRYAVAVAPKILIPDYPDDGKLWKDELLSVPHKIDVILENTETGEQMTIECIATTFKAHSYSQYPCKDEEGNGPIGSIVSFDIESGIIQTGIAYPNSGHDAKPISIENTDASIIEFIGTKVDFNARNYRFVKAIIIEE